MENDPVSTSGDASRASTQRVEIALIATLIVIWIPGILQLAEVWSSLEYASHGFLVPFVALWAATAHRVELARLESRPMAGGLVLMGLLACCYLAALLFRDSTLLGLVAVATVVAAVLALRGVAWVSTLRFSLGYLLFMVPLPVAWVTPVIVKLQLLVSSVGVEFLQRGGIAITSLITLLPIGVFIAYFTESISWRRLVLVGAVFPIALAGNLLRVILTVLLSIHVSVEFATHGPLHEWAGVATYVIGCACLLGVGALMRRFLPEDEPARSV